MANSLTITVTVTPPLETTLFADWTYISAGQSVLLTNKTTGGTGSNIYWYTYDCDGVSQTGNKFTFADATECEITLHVSDASGEANYSSNTITVTPPLEITSFTNTSRLYISTGQSVSFANTTIGGTGSNVWTYFLNGASTTSTGESITFSTAGTYTIALGVKDATGEISNSSIITVLVVPPLETTLTAGRSLISAEQQIHFSNATMQGTGGTTYSYSFSCEGATVGANDNVTFSTAGPCTVTLNVADASGETNSSSQTITVTPILTTELLNTSMTYISTGQSVSFANFSTGGTGGDINTYFVNGEKVTLADGSITFPTAGTYTVTLGTSDISGEIANSSSITVLVTPPLETTLTAGRSLISTGQQIHFSNVTLQGTEGYTYSYSFTCSGASVGETDNITFSTAGPCTVTLNVADASGETNSSSQTVTITPPLETTLTAGRILISAGQQVHFSNTTIQGTGGTTYSYSFSCDGASVGSNDNITFSIAVPCTVTLDVADVSGETNSSYQRVTVTPVLTTELLNTSRTYISTGQSVSFTNYSTGGTGSDINTYFVNGEKVTPVDGSILFPTAGTFTVTLGTTDISGEVSNSSSIIVDVTPPLETTLTAGRSLISAGQQIHFSNVTMQGTGGYTYFYTFSCEGASVGETDNITFSTAGPCTMTLNVADASGETNSSSQTVTVTPPLETTLTAGRNLISTGQQVHFSNTTIQGTGDNTYSYTFSCKGATVGETDNITFSTAGSCTVTLNVVDASGETNSSSQTITVTPPLETTLTAGRNLISVDQQVHLSNTTLQGTGGNTYSYTFSCDGASVGSNDNVIFSTAGSCTVTLNVADATGETNSSSQIIQVNQTLGLTFSGRDLISAGQQVHFSNITTFGTGGNQYSYSYECPGVTEGTTDNFTFPNAGTCTITLNVVDQSGEMNSSSETITVTPPLEVTLFESVEKVVQFTPVVLTNKTTGGTGSDVYYYTTSNSVGVTFNGNKVSFADTGVFNITIHVSDLSGETNQSTNTIIVDEPLLTNETFTSTPTVSRDQIISISSSGAVGNSGVGPYTYEWLYALPHHSTLNPALVCENPTSLTCTFQTNSVTQTGQYQFVLQITDSEIPKITVQSPPIYITVTNALVINSFFASPNAINAGQSVTLENVTTGGTGSNVYTYTVNNTSGVSGAGNIYTFENPGKYTVTLSVVDQSGENTTANTVVIVQTPLITELFNTSRLDISAGQSVYFTNITSGGTGGNVWAYFLNGALTTSTDGSITFPSAGSFVVTLGVKDNTAQIANSTGITVTVTPPLEITSFTSNVDGPISADQSLLLSNTTSGGTGGNTYSYSYDCDSVTRNGNAFTFETATTCEITLHVSDASGETNESIIIISPTAELITQLVNLSRTTISAGQSVSFTNYSTGGTGEDVNHYFVNGESVTPVEGSITFQNSGTYTVTLGTTDLSGEIANDTTGVTVTVTPPLEITSFTSNVDGPISADQSVLLSNTTSGGTGSNQYTYSYDCESVTNEGNIFTFTSAGTCEVTLHVSDASGETNQSTIELAATPGLTTQLVNLSRTTISAGQSVSFTNYSTGGTGEDVNHYFVNGEPVTLVEGSITFPSAGTYTVTLGTTDVSGEVANDTVGITVTVTPVLNAPLLVANTTLISADKSVSFTNTTTGGTGLNQYSYGVSCDSEFETPYVVSGNSIEFTQPATCDVTLYVSDVSGETNQSSPVSITITPPLVVSSFSANTNLISVGQTVGFTNTTSGGTGSNQYSYSVDCDDTGGANSINVGKSITFTNAGTCTVTLHVSDISGETNQSSVAITITPALGIQISPATTTVDQGQTINYLNTTTGGTGSNVYEYSESPSECASGTANAFQFSTLGTCEVTIYVTDLSGEKANSTSTVTVVSPPVITLTPSTTLIDAGQIVNFTNVTTGGVTPYILFAYTVNAPGTSSSGNSIAFGVAGNYIVIENVMDSAGGIGTSNPVEIFVNPAITISVPSVSNILVDQGQFETISDQAFGGTPPYTYNYIVTNSLNGNVVYDYIAAGVSAGSPVSFTYNTDNVPILNDELGNLNIELVLTDSVNGVVTSTDVDGIHAAADPQSNLTAIPQSIDLGQSTLLTANIGGGNGPYTYNFIITNSSNSVVLQQLVGPISSQMGSTSFTGTPASVGNDSIMVIVQDATNNPSMPCTGVNGCEILSNTITVSNTVYVPTTTIPQSDAGSGSGGGGSSGSSGSSGGGGGGSVVPIITLYNNGTKEGYQITNLTVDNFESLNFNNGTKLLNITVNYISPTDVGVTISNSTTSQSYNLTLDNPVVIVDPNNYTYYAELVNLTYLPILDSATVLMYGAPNQPAASGSSNASTAQVNTATVQSQPAATTIPATTTILPAATAAAPQNTNSTTSSSNSYLIVIALVVVVVVLVMAFSRMGRKGKRQQNKEDATA